MIDPISFQDGRNSPITPADGATQGQSSVLYIDHTWQRWSPRYGEQ